MVSCGVAVTRDDRVSLDFASMAKQNRAIQGDHFRVEHPLVDLFTPEEGARVEEMSFRIVEFDPQQSVCVFQRIGHFEDRP